MFLVEGMDYDYGLEIMMVIVCIQNMCRPGPAVLVLYPLNCVLCEHLHTECLRNELQPNLVRKLAKDAM